ncbi:50S ribosomal protein L11 methyltransferase [Desulfosoma sp.]
MDAAPSAPKGWWTADVPCEEALCDELAAVLAEKFGVGAQVEKAWVRLYLPAPTAPSQWKSHLEQAVAHFRAAWGLPQSDPVRYGFCEDVDWNARWKEGFTPLRVGRRLVIVPTWERYTPNPGDLVLTIDPGMAFGTGHHETTRLCLRWLEDVIAEWLHPTPPSLLDVGTGSGILAMAGALLGFRPVLGVDNDPDAVRIAEENRAMNPDAASVRFLTGTADAVRGTFSVVVANIQAGPLMAMAETLARKVAPGGRLGLCGVLSDQVASVLSRYEQVGFHAENRHQDGEWVLIALRARS